MASPHTGQLSLEYRRTKLELRTRDFDGRTRAEINARAFCPLPFFVPLIGQVSLTSPYTLLELWRITKVSAPTLSHGLLETHLSHQISGPSQIPLECALVAVFDIDSRGLHYHSTVTLTAMEMLATGSGRGVRMPSQDRMYYWLDNPSKDGIYHGPSP